VLVGRNLQRSATDATGIERYEVAPRASFGVGRRNLFGTSGSLNLFTRASFRRRADTVQDGTNVIVDNGAYGFNEYLARLSFSEAQIFGTDADGSLSMGVEQARRTSFSFNRRSGTASVGRRLKSTLALTARYTIDKTKIFDNGISAADRPLIDRLFPQVRLSTIFGSLVRDTRDDPLDPSSGSLVGLDAGLAARRLGSEVGFVKTFIQGFSYRKLPGGRVVAVSGARVGLATGFPRTIETLGPDGLKVVQTVDDLPASERFFAGGDTTVRGFTQDRLGRPDTIDAYGFPKGGHGEVILNQEFRIPVRGSLSAVAFVDAGNVFLHVNDIDLGLLRATAGFGFRFRSPIGPVRVDLGIKLDRQRLPNGDLERPTALHISLGQAF
jgi:outer membrane protein insertion porin family